MAGVGISRLREGGREGEEGKKHDGTHMDRSEDRRGGEGGDERREGWKRGIERTDVYLAFAVPARHLVSCPPSRPPFLPSFLRLSSLLSPPALSSLTERGERARECEPEPATASARVGAGVASEDARGKARRESVTRSWGCWVGVDHGPPCPRRLEGRPRHRDRRKGGKQARGAEG